jgi:hypothetical protein
VRQLFDQAEYVTFHQDGSYVSEWKTPIDVRRPPARKSRRTEGVREPMELSWCYPPDGTAGDRNGLTETGLGLRRILRIKGQQELPLESSC